MINGGARSITNSENSKKQKLGFWTVAKIEFLKNHYNKFNIPVINIANELNCTKNAVIGKANRLGLQNKKLVNANG